VDIAKDAGQGFGLRWSGMVFRGCNLKIVSRISPEIDHRSRKLLHGRLAAQVHAAGLADELREAMAELRLRKSPSTRRAMFLNTASSAVAVHVCPVLVGLLEFPEQVDLVTLAGRVWLAGCEYAAGTRTQDRRIMSPLSRTVPACLLKWQNAGLAATVHRHLAADLPYSSP
jgi:hypothetical protein